MSYIQAKKDGLLYMYIDICSWGKFSENTWWLIPQDAYPLVRMVLYWTYGAEENGKNCHQTQTPICNSHSLWGGRDLRSRITCRFVHCCIDSRCFCHSVCHVDCKFRESSQSREKWTAPPAHHCLRRNISVTNDYYFRSPQGFGMQLGNYNIIFFS